MEFEMVRSKDDDMRADNWRQRLSELADGEVDPNEISVVTAPWRARADVRTTWHAYQLIGDVLRSDELTGRGRDERFLAGIRAKLASEPVVLAPTALATSDSMLPRRSGVMQRWSAAVGVAAGVALVVGTLVVTRPSVLATDIPGSLVASAGQGSTAQAVQQLAAVPRSTSSSDSAAASVGVVRDPRLDQYLSAHKQYQSANALGATPGFFRSATYDAGNR